LAQSLGYTYNNDFNTTGFTYSGDTENYTYDNDGLLTSAGSFTITRNAQNGLPESVSGGALTQSRTFNGYGEQDGQVSTISGQGVGSWSLAQDDNGQITGCGTLFDMLTRVAGRSFISWVAGRSFIS